MLITFTSVMPIGVSVKAGELPAKIFLRPGLVG
jgi:hypothetical protein